MNSKLWVRKALSSGLLVAMLATYSMVALASDTRAAGELLVAGGENAVVSVDGTAAETGRTIFSGSTFSNSDNASATLNLGSAGSVRLAPNSTAVVTFDAKSISAKLSSGALTVINAASPVAVNGKAVASGATAKAADDDDDKDRGAAWWVFALVLGGATAALIGIVASDNDFQVGGSGTVVSPTR